MADSASSPVGYLISRPGSIQGIQGIGYDYVLGANGVFVQSRSEDLVARVRIAACEVRGLAAVDEKMELPHGLIPKHLFTLGLRWFQTTPDTERFFAIHWDGDAYRLTIPEQLGTASSLTYTPPARAVAEFHSHGNSRAYFSETDDRDEQGFRIYGVVGRMGASEPELNLRLGIYGHFTDLAWSEAFSDPAPGIRQVNTASSGSAQRRRAEPTRR